METPEEYAARRDRTDCTRIAKSTGRRCGHRRMWWIVSDEMPDPQSCERHLTDEEREALRRHRAKHAPNFGFVLYQPADGSPPVMRLVDQDPACWMWPAPESCTFADEQTAEDFLRFWNYRCAICDCADARVCDHDHSTGLVRGYLCASCNIKEGHAGNDGIFGKYRRRNPASILGLKLRYWDPFHGYADPSPASPPMDESATYVVAGEFEPKADAYLPCPPSP